MTQAVTIAQRLEETQALLQYAAHRLATRPNRTEATVSDVVSLSATSAALIEGEIAAAAKPSEAAAAGEQPERPPKANT